MIAVSLTKANATIPFSSQAVKRIAEFVCKKEMINNAELSFVIVDDRAILSINKKFLKHDFVTDVITFPLELNTVTAEIYINAEQAKRQAKEHAVTIKNEIGRLIVHSTLHAIGYDDRTKASKQKMDSIQERYVAELNL